MIDNGSGSAARHTNWREALDALVEDAPACGRDPVKVRQAVEEAALMFNSDKVRYGVIRKMHDVMLEEAHRGDD